MTYLIKDPENFKSKQQASYNYDLSVDRFMFIEGTYIPISRMDKPIIFDMKLTTNEALLFDNIINDSSCLLVNKKIADILIKISSEEVQFFDTEIRCKDGSLTNYKLVNITQVVKGVDYEKSLYSKMVNIDAISGFMRLKLLKNCMNGYKIARLEEFTGHMLATEDLKKVFESAGVTGLGFVTAEDYYADIYPGHAE